MMYSVGKTLKRELRGKLRLKIHFLTSTSLLVAVKMVSFLKS